MWKCNKCGCNEFIQHILGGFSYIGEINREGENTKIDNILDDLKLEKQKCELNLKILNDRIKVYESKRSTNE